MAPSSFEGKANDIKDHHSTNTTPELPTPRSRAAHWRSQLTQEDRKKLGLLLVDKFGEDFVSRPVQIEARAGLFQLERFKTRNQYDAVFVIAPTGSGKSLIFQATYLVYGRRAVTIVAHNLNQERKKAVLICKETWGDGELYQQLSDPSHTVSFILIRRTRSRRERVKLEAIKIAEWGFSESERAGAMSHAMEGLTAFRPVYGQVAERRLILGCQTLFLTAGAPPYKINRILKVSSLSESRTFFAKANLFQPNQRNIVVEMKPRTNGTMGSIRDLLNQRPQPTTFPQSIMYFNSREATSNALLAVHEQYGIPLSVHSPLARKYTAVRGEFDKIEDGKAIVRGKFPFWMTTSALGLGIHYPGIRPVTQYGRTTIEDDGQRRGRGGRSGQQSIALTWPGDRPRPELLTDDELSNRFFYESKACLSDLAVVLYTQGEFPLKPDEPFIVVEKVRQANIRRRSCQCSRCDPEGAKYIVDNLKDATEDNYNSLSTYDGTVVN
ncbi:BQ5605_C017g08462 [Microbotryum silenes-dioicae]|uniref:BQ5605_C017g08462 protein n=1 Tax=Microbotryum silenes-dioicae TaxID=796604 RepID=A0A2X0NYC4_9BASI|nr:BQ5605_C017g08462 [Microbotryum silenes-dioicae]